VWQSRHLRAIASIAFLSAAVTTIAGLQFRAIASQSIHDPNLLAAFFGTFSLRAGLLALACQVLLTTRVLNWIGAGALAIAPSLVGAASLGLWWSGTLTAATVLKGADHTVRYSIDRSALDTLYRPLTEHEVLEGKTVIDALVSRWGDTAGALMALLGTSVLHMQVRSLASMSVVLLAPWLVAVFVVNREYRGRLIEVLRTAPAVATSFCSPSVRPRGNGIRDPDPAVRLATLQALTRSPARRRGSRRDRAELHMILDAEIVALAVLADAAERGEAGAPTSTAREGGDTMARIARLLFLTAPDRYPTCLFGAVDGDGRLEPAALDYLEAALDRARRRLLVSAIERWKRATAARN
jgi:hypothetical protein